MLCLVLSGNTLEQNSSLIESHREYIDCAELRLDFLDEHERAGASEFSARMSIPLILTFRRAVDGGEFTGSESAREAALYSALEGGRFAFVDIEEDVEFPSVERGAVKTGTDIIRSYHSFAPFTRETEDRILSIQRRFPDTISKAAVMAFGTDDLLRLYTLGEKIHGKGGKKILIAMGEYGLPSRTLYRRFGSFLTFCSDKGSAAPGHLSPEAFVRGYSSPSISPATKLFGIVGDPVMHSRSPEIHNAGYRELGIDASYQIFPADDPEAFVHFANKTGIDGFSVTSPFKERIIPLLDGYDRVVEKIGSCNTVVRNESGWYGFNTDYPGFLQPLKRFWEQVAGTGFPEAENNSLRAGIIGAGGVARTVAQALSDSGFSLVILNRDAAKAESLASLYSCEWGGLGVHGKLSDCELIIQTTTAGMSPDEKSDPLPEYDFRKGQIVYDLIYSPEKTIFLERAEKSGCPILGGKEMLLEQACVQFQAFTGLPYPRSLFGR